LTDAQFIVHDPSTRIQLKSGFLAATDGAFSRVGGIGRCTKKEANKTSRTFFLELPEHWAAAKCLKTDKNLEPNWDVSMTMPDGGLFSTP
jgi:hypothetical protein